MNTPPTALITGASAGLGRALALALAARGARLVLTGRRVEPLAAICRETGGLAVPGDVTDPTHRAELAGVLGELGTLDLLVNNASTLGPSPMPRLAEFPIEELAAVYATNAIAALAITQPALPLLRAAAGTVVNISSDAAIEPYEGWGAYGSAKAALDQLTAVLAVENPGIHCYSFDPGDMRTEMQQAAFPGEDISDRPRPETVVPALLRLIDTRPACGRYRAAELRAIA